MTFQEMTVAFPLTNDVHESFSEQERMAEFLGEDERRVAIGWDLGDECRAVPECGVKGGGEGRETAVEVSEAGHVGEFAEAADAVFLVVHGAEELLEGDLVVAGFHAFFEGA